MIYLELFLVYLQIGAFSFGGSHAFDSESLCGWKTMAYHR